MNLTDLATELSTHAARDVPVTDPAGSTARLAAVRRRSHLNRRRRAGGLLAVILLIALAGNLVPKPWLDRHDRAARVPDRVGVFPAFDGDDPLSASAVGRIGQTELELRFSPSDANLRIDFLCSGGTGSKIVTKLALNGHQEGGMSCGGGGTGGFSHSDDATRNRAGFAADGVRAGQESVLRLTYTGTEPQQVRLGLGVYELTGPSTMVGGRRLRQAVVLDGRRYQLAAYSAVALSTHRRSVTLPGRYGGGLVACYGSGGGDGTDELLVDGNATGGSSAGGFGCQTLDPGPERTVGARSSRRATGTLVVALYRVAGSAGAR